LELLPPAQGPLSSSWPALLERDSHPLEYATLPGRTERLRLTQVEEREGDDDISNGFSHFRYQCQI
jgi:hypothetical protein